MTRETFFLDKIDEVEHSDLLMFHYSSRIGVWCCEGSLCFKCDHSMLCHEVLPLVLIRLAHHLTVLTSTSLTMLFGQTFTSAKRLRNFSNLKNLLSRLVRFNLTAVSAILESTMLLPFVERNICDLEDVVENVQGIRWCYCSHKERMQADKKKIGDITF